MTQQPREEEALDLSALIRVEPDVRGAVVADIRGNVRDSIGELDADGLATAAALVTKSLRASGDALGIGSPRVLNVSGLADGCICLIRGDDLLTVNYGAMARSSAILQALEAFSWSAKAAPARTEAVVAPPGVSEHDKPHPRLRLLDTFTNGDVGVYGAADGAYVLYRIAVLGLGGSAQQVHGGLEKAVKRQGDPLGRWDIAIRYRIELIQGDAKTMLRGLALFQPNLLVLVNAGAVKNNFADATPQQLMFLSRDISKAATAAGQRPYSLVWVTDKPVESATFAEYTRLCGTMNVVAASAQFSPEAPGQVLDFARNDLKEYAYRYYAVEERTKIGAT